MLQNFAYYAQIMLHMYICKPVCSTNSGKVSQIIIYLYPSQRGMQAYAEALEFAKANNPDQPDTNTLINLLEIVLKTIHFNLMVKAIYSYKGQQWALN